MTTYPILSLHPATRDSIEAQGVTATEPTRTYRCGCHERGMGRMWLCPYHDGFDDGAEPYRALAPEGVPLDVWVGKLLDALRDASDALGPANPFTLRLDALLALAGLDDQPPL